MGASRDRHVVLTTLRYRSLQIPGKILSATQYYVNWKLSSGCDSHRAHYLVDTHRAPIRCGHRARSPLRITATPHTTGDWSSNPGSGSRQRRSMLLSAPVIPGNHAGGQRHRRMNSRLADRREGPLCHLCSHVTGIFHGSRTGEPPVDRILLLAYRVVGKRRPLHSGRGDDRVRNDGALDCYPRLPFGSNASRRPSPTKLNASTAIVSASPGRMASMGSVR